METSSLKRDFASRLLRIKAVKLQPNDPFTWASGWKSPIYCDNRKTLSYPDVRTFVKIEMVHAILKHFPSVDTIAGVATAGIPQAALIADILGLPLIYVRSKAKDHGLENLIEGEMRENARIVVIEDLISTGGSSLKAVEAIRQAGGNPIGMIASVTYGFPVAEQAFADAKLPLVTLTDYNHIIEEALATGYILESDTEMLQDWRKDPAHWRQ